MKRPFLYLVICFSAGILAARHPGIPIIYPFIASVAALALALVAARRTVFAHAALYLATLFFGVVYYLNAVTLPADHIYDLISDEKRPAAVKGTIVNDPVTVRTPYGEKTVFTLHVDAIQEGEVMVASRGLVAASVYSARAGAFGCGDEVLLEGRIARPAGLKNPGLFDYAAYLDAKNIYGVLTVQDGARARVLDRDSVHPVKGLAYRIRGGIRRLLDRYVDDPYRGFLKAILIGDRTGLEYSIKDEFVKTGTVHMLAISGLHVGLIAALLLACCTLLRLPRKAGLVLVAAALIVYSFVAGSSPPIVRAVTIFCIAVMGYVIGRQNDMLNSLSLAAMLILLWNPKALFDVSFQLSFLSVASIVVLTPRIDALLRTEALPRTSSRARFLRCLMKSLSVSAAAWIGTWPVIAAYFNIVSPIAIAANIVMVPMLFGLTTLAALFLVVAPAGGVFAAAPSFAVEAAAGALFRVNGFFAALPHGYWRAGAPPAWFLAAYYALLLIWVLPAPIVVRRVIIGRKRALIAVLIILNAGLWGPIIAERPDVMKITFLDVGQGDAAFIEFPGKGTMLIDAGSGGEDKASDMGRSVVAPFLWNRSVRRIDALVITHMHEDHVGGAIYVLRNFDVGAVIDNGMPDAKSDIYNEYMRTIRERGVRHIAVRAGQAIRFSDDVGVLVLNPPAPAPSDQNNGSVVLKVAYKNFSALFCGDIETEAMENIVSMYGDLVRSVVIKVPHHGGKPADVSIAKHFFSAVAPETAIVSVGRSNRYNMPSAVMMSIITSSGAISYETKKSGAISLVIKPDSCAVRPAVGHD